MSAPLLPRVDEAAVRSASRYSLLGLLEEMLKYADEFIKFGQVRILNGIRCFVMFSLLLLMTADCAHSLGAMGGMLHVFCYA